LDEKAVATVSCCVPEPSKHEIGQRVGEELRVLVEDEEAEC
jgi:hypothetical protein